jgi:hypothetical protein
MLKRSPHYGRITLDLVISLISPKARGWEKYFFVKFLMTSYALRAYSNCLTPPEEEPSLALDSFSFSALRERLVVGFISGILPTTITQFRYFAIKLGAHI